MQAPLSKRKVLAYLRLETSPDTAERLTAASLHHLGAFDSTRGRSHFWSYPSDNALAWVELTEGGTLTLPPSVPQAVRDATPARSAHALRALPARPAAAPPLARRARPERAVWVPDEAVPAYVAQPAWVETTSFDEALQRYGARATTDRGAGTRAFHLQLTSGRYACIEWQRDFPQTVAIFLELDTSRADGTSAGALFVRDIEEILQPMGARFAAPARRLLFDWCHGD